MFESVDVKLMSTDCNYPVQLYRIKTRAYRNMVSFLTVSHFHGDLGYRRINNEFLSQPVIVPFSGCGMMEVTSC